MSNVSFPFYYLPIIYDVLIISFFLLMLYNGKRTGGIAMNPFEKDVQCKRNDAMDSGVGFGVSFVFFALIYVIAVVVEFVSR